MGSTPKTPYNFGERWISAGQARKLLLRAAQDLGRSSEQRDQDAAKLITRNWQAVASRPQLFYEAVDRATVLRFSHT